MEESYLVPHQRRLTWESRTSYLANDDQPAAWAFGSLGFRFAGGGGRWRADMASGGEGFGTERARLAGDGLSIERARLAQGGYRGQGFGTERARLAQGGFLGQFYISNPFKRNF